MPADTAQRAEDLITAKSRRDAAVLDRARSLQLDIASWGRTVGLRVPALPELAFYNKARGVNADDLAHLPAICAFFTSAGITPTLEVWAADASDRLGAALVGLGLSAGTVTAVLHRHLTDVPRSPGAADGTVTVTELDPADPDADYFATLVGGYGLADARPERRAMLHAEHDPATVRRYVARVDGRPAAAAGLYLHPDGALLSGAATLPEYRRRGCQAALIRRRLADAALVTDLAVVTVAYGSTSQTNLERAGFHLTHARTSWQPLEPSSTRGVRCATAGGCRAGAGTPATRRA
ncbi:hypothetical protein ACPPVS_18670 [Cellulomonas sp. McL0617]|uniref:hypothetical protein n=1 Tax=Cellulomonas sp. McL0617 TaxID=3415675 RepID=UPI003CE7D58D